MLQNLIVYKIQLDYGNKKPNKIGRDIFLLFLQQNRNKVDFQGNHLTSGIMKQDNAYSSCKKGDTRTDNTPHGRSCGALIQWNGWKISDDYPW